MFYSEKRTTLVHANTGTVPWPCTISRPRSDGGRPATSCKKFTNLGEDGAYIALRFRIDTTESNLVQADDAARKVEAEILEAGDRAADEVGPRVAEIAARLSGWGSKSPDQSVDAVGRSDSADAKGRMREELCSRFFSSVAGFAVTGRIRTETEEIDISVLNDIVEARLRQDGTIILVECKKWTGKCARTSLFCSIRRVRTDANDAVLVY